MSNWLTQLNQDWITVYQWNPRLYRRVSLSGFVFGFLTAVFLVSGCWGVAWLVAT